MVDPIERAAQLISNAHSILIVTGAGMGIDSGLPDFRGPEGFWKAYPALGRQGIGFSDIASPDAFRKQPRLAWGFYGHRLALYRATQPHAGFSILRRWVDDSLMGGAVFTSNVDGQFEKASFDGQLQVECHGSIHHLQCLENCRPEIWPARKFFPEVDMESGLLLNELPVCPHCGSLARPNIYMFDDFEWQQQRTQTQFRRLDRWLQSTDRLLVIEIGAGRAIATAREFTHRIAFELKAPVIRINPDEAGIHPRHVSLVMGALPALKAIEACLDTDTPAAGQM